MEVRGQRAEVSLLLSPPGSGDQIQAFRLDRKVPFPAEPLQDTLQEPVLNFSL